MNKFCRITITEKELLVEELPSEYVFCIDGQKIQKKADAIKTLTTIFDINIFENGNWDALDDWLTREKYIHFKEVYLFIDNAEELFKNDSESKEIFLDILLDKVKWWDNEVEQCTVGGSKKRFDVYLVENKISDIK